MSPLLHRPRPAGPRLARPRLETLETREVPAVVVGGGVHQSAAFQFSPDGKQLAVLAQDASSGQVFLGGRSVGGKHTAVYDLTFSPDSKHLAFVAQDATTWHVVEDGRRVGGFYSNPSSGTAFAPTLLQFSPFGDHLGFIAPSGRNFRFVKDGRAVGPAFPAIDSFQFSPNGLHLALFVETAGGTGEIIQDGHDVNDSLPFPAPDQLSPVYQFSPDSKHLAVTIQGSDPTTSEVLLDGRVIAGQHQTIYDTQFSADSKHLVFEAQDVSGYQIIETQVEDSKGKSVVPDGKPVATPFPNPSPGFLDASVQFSPNSQHLAYVAFDGTTYQLTVDGKAVGAKYQAIGSVAYSPNGRHLALSGLTSSGWQVVEDNKVIGGNHAFQPSFQFSPNSQHLAIVTGDALGQQVLEDGQPVDALHESVSLVVFSPDSTHLGSIVQDPYGWRVLQDGKFLGGTYFTAPTQLAFSPDNKHFAFTAPLNTGNVVLEGLVLPAAPAKVTFKTQPRGVRAANEFLAPFAVQVLDHFGNPINTPVTLTLVVATPGLHAAFSGKSVLTVTPVKGVATFGKVALDAPGKYRIVAFDGAATAESKDFSVG